MGTIIQKKGNILDDPKANIIVIPVNSVGITKQGLIGQLAQRDRCAINDYHKQATANSKAGDLFSGVPGGEIFFDLCGKYLFFCTKDNPEMPTRLTYVDRGLNLMIMMLGYFDRMSSDIIAIPAFGCGKSGLDYGKDIFPMIDRYLKGIPGLTVHAYLPR